jgi:hypothetical protein
MIESTFNKVGAEGVLWSLCGGYFDGVFEDSTHKSFIIGRDARKWRKIFYRYPYGEPPAKFMISPRKPKAKKDRTLWHDYIDTILTRRHAVAHGNIKNDTTHEELRSDIMKLSVLMHAIAYGVVVEVK